MRSIRDASRMPVGLPAMEWMLEVGAFFMHSESELILKSRRVVPGRLLAAGFTFKHPEWQEAARDLVSRRRRSAL
jgi:NAD dependent epimerase/dehydratase family enzyme